VVRPALICAFLFCLSRVGVTQTGAAYREAAAAFAHRDFAVAADQFAKAEEESPAATNALLQRAKALVHLDRYPEAEESLRRYIKDHSAAAEPQFLLGYVLFRRNQPRESLAAYTAAAAIQRPIADDFKIVGMDYVLLNDYPDAIRWLERSAKEDPRDAEVHYALGRAYYTQNSFDRAIASFEQALKLNPKLSKAENNLGLAFAAVSRYEDAEAAYRRAIQLDTDGGKPSEQPYLNLAELLLARDHAPESLRLLDTASKIDPKNVRIDELRGRALLSQNRLDEAAAAFRTAIAANPGNGSLHYQLARTLKRLGKDDEAAREFELSRTLLGANSSPAR